MENIDFLLLMEEEMAFGLQTNVYGKASEGSYGYTIKLNIATYLPQFMRWVQATNQPLSVDPPVTSSVTLAVLQTYPDLVTCPDMAWAYEGENLHIFFKEAVYPYVDNDCRFAYEGLRYAMMAVTDSALVDVPDEHLDTLVILARETAWNLKKNMVDKDLAAQLKQKKFEIISGA